MEWVRGPRYEGCVNKKSKWFEVVTQAAFKWVPSRIKLVTKGSRLDTSGSKLASDHRKFTQVGPKLAQVSTRPFDMGCLRTPVDCKLPPWCLLGASLVPPWRLPGASSVLPRCIPAPLDLVPGTSWEVLGLSLVVLWPSWVVQCPPVSTL